MPLIAHDRPDAVVAFRGGLTVTAERFLAQVRQLAARLPPRPVINLCGDRYRFAVTLSAALLRGQSTLLPSTHTPETLRQLRALAPQALLVTDEPDHARDLPGLLFSDEPVEPHTRHASARGDWSVPELAPELPAIHIFTSGSTGAPVPHLKPLGSLCQSVRAAAARLPPIGAGGCAIVATVPPQHMYGLESSVLLPLWSGGALCAERPFFPSDIATALAALPRPRALVTTPVHLRALVEQPAPCPAVDLIVSATAPLPRELAREAERRFGATLLEIYGSTETGQLATRRTVHEERWRLWPGVELTCSADGRCSVAGGHIATPTRLADILEPSSNGGFLLRGRSTDLVNIAGKRSSIAYLNHQLTAIAGVVDGVFFMREPDAQGIARLAALVVAPRLTEQEILTALRERLDPVFLPRPLLRVEQLPRNATGKLPQQALQALLARLGQAAADCGEVPADS
jgi:acyl-coenzyme A synthetase/AMP-(fatty) acid ligase